MPGPTIDTFPDLGEQRIQIAGRHQTGSRKTRKRRARYRIGIEGRISHLRQSASTDKTIMRLTRPRPPGRGRFSQDRLSGASG